jgi:rhodanese-related sulfurtransferase
MKKLLLTMLVAAIAFGQQNANTQKRAPSQAKELTRAEFEDLLAKPDQVLLIDLRRPDEVTKVGGFPAYFSIQIADLDKSLAWIPRDRTIITVSNHATRSGQAADILARNGFKVAGTIGAQTYEEQGGKLTKIVPPPVRPADGDTAVTEKK